MQKHKKGRLPAAPKTGDSATGGIEPLAEPPITMRNRRYAEKRRERNRRYRERKIREYAQKSDEEILELLKRYENRTELCINNPGLHSEALARGLLNDAMPKKTRMKRRAVERIMILYTEKMAGASDKEGTRASFGLTETEAKVLDYYVLARTTERASDIAATIGCSNSMLNYSLRRIEGKLSGDPDMYLKELARRKYRGVSDGDLLKEAGEYGKTGLRKKKNLLLYALKDRGIYDEAPTASRHGTSDMIKNEVLRIKNDDPGKWDGLFRSLTPLEQDLITMRAVCPTPVSRARLEKMHGLRAGVSQHAEQVLLKKLTGANLEGNNGGILRMREAAGRIGMEKMAKFRETLKPVEQAILDQRISQERPMTLKSVGEQFGLTRERVRQIGKRLEMKMRNFEETGDPSPGIRKRREKYGGTGDEELIRMARDYRTKTGCYRKDQPLHNELRKRGLLDAAYPVDKRKRTRRYGDITDEELVRMAKAYGTKMECRGTDLPFYKELGMRGLLDTAYPIEKRKKNDAGEGRGRKRKYGDTGDEGLMEAAKGYAEKGECRKKNGTLYKELGMRGLLDTAYPAGRRKRTRKYGDVTDEELVRMAKALTRKKCREKHASLYAELGKRKLLDVVYRKRKRK